MRSLFFISLAVLLTSCAQGGGDSAGGKLTEIQKLFPCKPNAESILQQSLSGDIPDLTDTQCACIQGAIEVDMNHPSFDELSNKFLEEIGGMKSMYPSELLLNRIVAFSVLNELESPTTINKKCDLDYSDLGDMSPN